MQTHFFASAVNQKHVSSSTTEVNNVRLAVVENTEITSLVRFQEHRFPVLRAGLIMGKPGKFPGPRAFEGLTLGYQNTPLLFFHIFRLFTTRQNCRAF